MFCSFAGLRNRADREYTPLRWGTLPASTSFGSCNQESPLREVALVTSVRIGSKFKLTEDQIYMCIKLGICLYIPGSALVPCGQATHSESVQ